MGIPLAPILGAGLGAGGGTIGSSDFLNDFMSTRFGGVKAREASNADELEEARQAGNQLGLFPDALMPLNQGLFEPIPYGENLQKNFGQLRGLGQKLF